MRAIITRSWILTIHKDKMFWKILLKNKEKDFQNGVKNIQAATYNGVRKVMTNLGYLTRMKGFQSHRLRNKWQILQFCQKYEGKKNKIKAILIHKLAE